MKTIRTNEIGGGTEQSLWRGGGTEQSLKRKLVTFTIVACLTVTVLGLLGGGTVPLFVNGGGTVPLGGGTVPLSVLGGGTVPLGGGTVPLTVNGGGTESW